MIKAKTHALEALQAKLQKGSAGIQDTVRLLGLETLEQMIHNLSGNEVSWSGGSFVVNVRTGNLRRMTRLDYPLEGDSFSFGVFNRASYARTLERGQTGPERLRSLLFGGSPPQTSKKGGLYKRIAYRGRTSSGRLRKGTTFFTVTPGSVLADIPPRPFVEATLEQMQSRIEDLLRSAVSKILK